MTTYRERLTAPVAWWLAALAFAAAWGWVMLIATNTAIALVTFLAVAAVDLYAVWRYGSLTVTVDESGLRVGGAFLETRYVGTVAPLNRADYRNRLGTGADARAYLVTRPYVDHGVSVGIDDPSDPAPYWLVSSRHPQDLAAALGAPAAPEAPVHDPNGDTPRGKEV